MLLSTLPADHIYYQEAVHGNDQQQYSKGGSDERPIGKSPRVVKLQPVRIQCDVNYLVNLKEQGESQSSQRHLCSEGN